MKLARRQFLHLAAGIATQPALSAREALAQRTGAIASLASPSAQERAEIANIARACMQTYSLPGFSVAVGYRGAIAYQDAFGFADHESNQALTPMHLFRIGSVSKPITAVAIFTLIERGRLKLTDKVFGPGAITGTDYGGPPFNAGVDEITVEHLLTHTAGGWDSASDDPIYLPLANRLLNHTDLISWTLKNRPLVNPPGQRFRYSNFGYCVLGRVVEKITGKPYAAYVHAEVLKRCGITDMAIGGNTLEQRFLGEVKYYGQEDKGEFPYGENMSRADANGGWIARPADLVQFLMHVDGFDRSRNILSLQTIQTMIAPSAAAPGYAKGWFVNKEFDNWWHTGTLAGVVGVALRTHSGYCWAAFANSRRSGSPLEGELADNLIWNMVRRVKRWPPV